MARSPSSGNGRPAGDGRPLPPELDPRGRRAARRAAGSRTSAADRTAAGTPPTPGPGRSRPGRTRGGRGAAHGLVLGVRIVAATLSLAILLGSGWAWASYKKFTGDIATGSSLSTGGKDIDGKDQNILLLGSDSRDGATPAELQQLATQQDGGSANTDTMIVLHVPANGSKATLISFPRDSWVDIPGHGTNRINSAYPDAYTAAKSSGASETDAESAGIALTARTISQLTGLTIDHYLQVNLLGFYRISVAIGGVDVCLNEAQHDPYSGINLPAGVSHIEGTQALAFVRQRHGLPNGDLDRIKRQQYFLGAVFRKVSSAGVLLNPFKLNDLLGAVSSSLLKDPGLDLLSLAQQAADLQAGNITFTTMQTTGPETIDGNDVLGVDPSQVRQQIEALIGQGASEVAGAAAAPAGSFAVTVLNGGAPSGSAAANAALLTAAGFKVASTGDAPQQVGATEIEYPAGMAGQAKTLAAQVPGAAVLKSSSVSGVTLVLGPDGKGVTNPAAAGATPAPATSATGAAQTRSGSDLSCIN